MDAAVPLIVEDPLIVNVPSIVSCADAPVVNVNLPLATPFEFLWVMPEDVISIYALDVAPTIIPVVSILIVGFTPAFWKYVPPNVQPPIVPACALSIPFLDTLNGAKLSVAFPKYIPYESDLNIEFPDPIERSPVKVPPPLTVRVAGFVLLNSNNFVVPFDP